MRVKHFRLETEEKRYLLALLPINFGKLADDRAVEAAITTEGYYLLAIDDDAYVEADPYGWIGKDEYLMYTHFYLREKAHELRGGAVLCGEQIKAEVGDVVRRLISERGGEPGSSDADGPREVMDEASPPSPAY